MEGRSFFLRALIWALKEEGVHYFNFFHYFFFHFFVGVFFLPPWGHLSTSTMSANKISSDVWCRRVCLSFKIWLQQQIDCEMFLFFSSKRWERKREREKERKRERKQQMSMFFSSKRIWEWIKIVSRKTYLKEIRFWYWPRFYDKTCFIECNNSYFILF